MSLLISLLEEIRQTKDCKNIKKYSHKYQNEIYLWKLDPSMEHTVAVIFNKVKAMTSDSIMSALRKFDIKTTLTTELLATNIVQKDGEYE